MSILSATTDCVAVYNGGRSPTDSFNRRRIVHIFRESNSQGNYLQFTTQAQAQTLSCPAVFDVMVSCIYRTDTDVFFISLSDVFIILDLIHGAQLAPEYKSVGRRFIKDLFRDYTFTLNEREDRETLWFVSGLSNPWPVVGSSTVETFLPWDTLATVLTLCYRAVCANISFLEGSKSCSRTEFTEQLQLALVLRSIPTRCIQRLVTGSSQGYK